MTETEMELCLERGAEVVRRCREEGSNILSFGEMGIGNTSSSSLWMSCFTGIPLKRMRSVREADWTMQHPP